MEKIQKNLNYVITILLIFSIVLAGILIGSPVKDNMSLVYMIIAIMTIVLLIQKGIKKEKILTDPMDILVLVLCISSCIPILTRTYTSLADSISFALKYSCIFGVYWVTKHVVRQNKKIVQYVIYVILFLTVILTLLGIDKLTYYYTKPLVNYFNIMDLYQGEFRITSLFCYANSFAVMVVSAIFLALGQMLNKEKTLSKAIYYVIIFLCLVGVFLSLSRMMFAMLGMLVILYVILSKGRKNKIEIVETLGVNLLLSILYVTRFMKSWEAGDYLAIWIGLAIFGAVSFGITFLCTYANRKLMKWGKKNLMKLGVVVVILVIFSIMGMVLTPANLVLFYTSRSQHEIERHLSHIQGSQEYLLNFELEAKSIQNQKIFTIEIIERNPYWKDTKVATINIGDFSGKQEIKIHTLADTTDLFIVFRASEVSKDTKLEIKDFSLNGKRIYLDYQFLPYNLVSKIDNMTLNTQSVVDRTIYIKDAFKLIQDNWLLGIGGDGWHYRYQQIQS